MAYNNVKVRARQTVKQTSTQTKDLGTVSEVPMGEWNVDTPYKKLNLVRYNGATYIATQDNQGATPTGSGIWLLVNKDGRGVTDTTITYQAGISGATPPTGEWVSEVPTVPQGQYLWTRIIFTYTGDTSPSTFYTVSYQAIDGNAIDNVEIDYSFGISNTTPPTDNWTSEMPNVPQGQYLWTRTTTHFTQSEDTVAYSVSLQSLGFAQDDRDKINEAIDSVILQEDLTLAGNYIQVGNISKGSETATITYPAKGKTVTELLQEIFSKKLQPQITQMPSVTGFALNSPSQVEAGASVQEFTYGTAALNPGSYTYGPATGVEAQSYKVDRICQPTNMSQEGISSAVSGTDNNGGNGFVIGDSDGANVVSSIQYKVTVNYNEGAIALDNMGGESDPIVRIPAGSATQSTIAVTPYRNYFYGTTAGSSPPSGTSITSVFVRGLTKSNRAYATTTFTLNVPAGSTGIYIACIASRVGVTKVINETALNADVTDTFAKQVNVDVEGANSYASVAYNVWYYIPAVPYENDAILKVTLG